MKDTIERKDRMTILKREGKLGKGDIPSFEGFFYFVLFWFDLVWFF